MTDKYPHGLIEIYEQRFIPDKPVTLLELGVLAGESLDYFAKYFTHKDTRIIGVDLQLPAKRKDPRITMLKKDQRDPSLAEIKPDIVIDDASHVASYTEESFRNIWPSVKSGGVYVIEDWHGDVLPEMEELLIRLMKEVVANKVFYRNDKTKASVAFFYKEG